MAQGRQEAAKLLAEQQTRLSAVEGLSGVKLDIDFDHFINHLKRGTSFKESSRQEDLLRSLVSDVVEKGLWASDEGLVAWLNKSERARQLFAAGTERCVVRLSADNQVDSGVGNSYYMIRFEAPKKTMVVTARMDCVTYTDGWGPKVDEQLGLHVLDEVYVNEGTDKLKRAEERFRSALAGDADIPLEVDWASFVASPQFRERGDSSRQSVIHSVVESLIERGLWDSNEGMLVWLAKSPRARAIVLSRVARIVVALSPDSSGIEPRNGNSYYQLRLVDGVTLAVTARMDCVTYTDGWGQKLDDELGLHVLDEVYMKEATELVARQEERLQVDLGGVGVLLEVDWASFVASSQFLERGDSSRQSVIRAVSESVIERGLWDSSEGLVSIWINGSRRVRRLVLERVNKIVVRLQPDSSLPAVGTGNSYYQVELDTRDGQQSLVVTARLDCVTYTDGWGQKVDERLGLHYLDETYLRSATQELAAKAAALQSDLSAAGVKLHVDWDSFVRSPQFLERGDSSRQSVINSVVESVIQRGVWDSSDGLVAFAREHPEASLASLAAVVVKLSPDSQVNYETGNSYYGLSVSAGPTITVTVRLDCVTYTDGWREKLNHHLGDLKSATKAPVDLDQVHEYLQEQPEPTLPGPAIPCDIHAYMLAPGQIATPQLSEEAKQAREQALAAAKARKEAEEAKKREAEELQRQRIEEQRRKREEAQAAMRARQAERQKAAGRPLPSPGGAKATSASACGAPDESIAGVKDLLKDLKSYESQFNSAVGGGCAVDFAVDWSFTTDRAFTGLTDDQRRSCIAYHLQGNVSSLVNQLNSVARDSTAREEIQSGLFTRVVVGFDTANAIDSRVVDNDYARFYEVALRDGELQLRINFNKRDAGLSSLDDKLACALNLQVAQSQAETRRELDELEKRIAAELGAAIALDVDWAFTQSDAFLGGALRHEIVPYDDLRRYRSVIYNLHYQYVQGVITSSESLLYLCRDEIYRAAVVERIASIVFAYDPADGVRSPVGGDYARHWEMKLDAPAKRLHVTINLSSNNQSSYGAKEKWDELMQLRTAQGIRNAEREIAATVERERERIGKRIEVEVAWDSFTSHSAYTALALDAKSSLLRNVHSQHVEALFTSSSGLGYMCSRDEIYKRTIQARIDKVVLTYDPTNAVRDAIGGDYGAFYRVELAADDRRELRVTINLNKADQSLYSLSDKLDEVLDVRVEQKQRDANKEIEQMRAELAAAFGSPSVALAVDWESFTGHAAFLAKPLEERGRIVSQINNQMVSTIANSSDGLARTAANEPTAKVILAREIKSVVVAIDPTNAVIDTVAGDNEYCRHYRLVHSGAPACELRVVCNLNAVDKGLYSFYDKIDTLFNLSIAKAQRQGQAELDKFAAALRAQGIAVTTDGGVRIDYARFVGAPQFVAQPAAEKGRLVTRLIDSGVSAVVEGSDGLLRLCAAEPGVAEWAKAHVRSVVLAYDPASSINDPAAHRSGGESYSAYYSVALSDDGELAITVNLSSASSVSSFYELPHKLRAQLHFADARKRRFPAALERHRQAMESAVGHQVALTFDWRSLDNPSFLYWRPTGSANEALEIAFDRPTGFFTQLAQLVADVCSTPMGKQAFAAAVSGVAVTAAPSAASTTLTIDADRKLLKVVAPAGLEGREWDVAQWRESVEYQLGQTVAVAKHYALLNVARVEQELSAAVGKRVPVTIDWRHIEAPAFIERHGPALATRRIRTLSQALAESLLMRGLAAVCVHPVGKRTVNETIARVVISLDPTADYSPTVYGHFPSLLTIDADKTLTLRTDKEAAAADERFKERIEFALDLVVRIAESNAQARHDAAQAAVRAAVGRPTLKIEADLGFTALQAFRVLPPAQQADIVTALCASLPEAALASPGGLLGVVAHAVGKNAMNAPGVDVIHLSADPENRQPSPNGALALGFGGKRIEVTLNMRDVLAAVERPDWKPRMADALGVLLDVAKAEAATALAPTATKLGAALGRPTPVALDWSAFVGAREWVELAAGDKLGISAEVAGSLAARALLGYQGLAGLAEFDDVKATVNQHIASVRIVIETRAGAQTAVNVASGVMTLSLPLDQLKADASGFTLPSVRFLVEAALGLKPAIQAAVVRETEAALASGTEAGLSRALGKPIKVTIDWAALFGSALYRGTQDYVGFIRKRVAPLPATAFDGKDRDSLAGLWAANDSARRAMAERFGELKLVVDTTNACHPPQFRFVPQYYRAEVEGATTLAVHMRIDEQGGRGCGGVVEWVLTPDVAAAKEKAEIARIANERRSDELARRDRMVRDAAAANERAQKDYQRDIKKYENDMKKYEKDVKEKHFHCKGTGWLSCGGSYHKKGSTLRSCQYCNGKGGHSCGLCKGTGLKYPNLKPPSMPKQPKLKPIPTFPSIDSIDFTRNIS